MLKLNMAERNIDDEFAEVAATITAGIAAECKLKGNKS